MTGQVGDLPGTVTYSCVTGFYPIHCCSVLGTTGTPFSINNCFDIRDTGLLLCSETLLGRGSGQMKDAFIYTQKSLSLAKNKEKGNTEKDHDNLMRICSFEGTRLGLTVVVLHHYSRLYCTSFWNKQWIFTLHTIKTTFFFFFHSQHELYWKKWRQAKGEK